MGMAGKVPAKHVADKRARLPVRPPSVLESPLAIDPAERDALQTILDSDLSCHVTC